MNAPNQVVCPRCGEVRLETPPGTRALPTIGLVRKAAGGGVCDCGRQDHRSGEPEGDGTDGRN